MGRAAWMVCSRGGAGVVALATDAWRHCLQMYCVLGVRCSWRRSRGGIVRCSVDGEN